MYDEGKCIDFFLINQDIQFDQFTALIATEFIIKRSISSGTGFQCIKEIIDNLIQRELVFQQCSRLFHVFHSDILTTAFLAEIHDRTDKLGCYHDLGIYHRLFHIFNLRWIRKVGWVGQFDHLSIGLVDLVDNSRCCRYEVQIIFSLKTLLNNLKMKKSKETTAETKAECYGCLRLKKQGSIV